MIKLFNTKDFYIKHQDEFNTIIHQVLLSGNFLLDEYTKKLEQAFAAYCNTNACIGVNSGTSALHLALLAAGVGKDDEVITTPYTFIATANTIRYVNAKPIFVDISLPSFTIDPAQIESKITKKTKAIIPVHLYGQMADMDPILSLAKKYNLIVIEDCAQANGAIYKQKKAGSLGDFGCFSFYPTKNLGAFGDAGMITCNNPAYVERLNSLRNCGRTATSQFYEVGYNYRISEIQAAIVLLKLKYLDQCNFIRNQSAQLYETLLKATTFDLPVIMPYNMQHVYGLFTVRHKKRNDLMTYLKNNEIETGIYYAHPLHLQPAYADLGYKLGDFPCAEQAANESLSIPLYPELSSEQIELIATKLKEFDVAKNKTFSKF